MDILAWIILALVVSVLVLPCIAALFSNDPFITYKEAWALGHAILAIVVFVGMVVSAVIWASDRVLW